LTVDFVRRASRLALRLRRRFGLDGSRHRLVEDGTHRFITAQHAFFDQRPKQRNRRADGCHRVGRILECAHCTLSDDRSLGGLPEAHAARPGSTSRRGGRLVKSRSLDQMKLPWPADDAYETP
jgi:hypothetical protein